MFEEHRRFRAFTKTRSEKPVNLIINDKQSELLKNMVAEQLNIREEKLSALKTQMADKFPIATAKKQQYGHFCVLQHAIEREAGYIDWLKRIWLKWCDWIEIIL